MAAVEWSEWQHSFQLAWAMEAKCLRRSWIWGKQGSLHVDMYGAGDHKRWNVSVSPLSDIS